RKGVGIMERGIVRRSNPGEQSMSNYPEVILTEEGIRDGLQIERADIPVKDKIRLLDALSETGLREIAVGSFVSPRWVPQMACIHELVQGFHPHPALTYV